MADLIKLIRSKGRVYLYFWPGKDMMARGARPARLPDNVLEARTEVRRLVAMLDAKERPEFRRHVISILKGARRRCRASGVEITLTEAEVTEMLDRQGYRCAVTGILFDLEATGPNLKAFRRPYRPSLDRIRSKGPYSRENVRLVCVAVNVAINEWGDEVYRRLARALVETETFAAHRLETGLANAAG